MNQSRQDLKKFFESIKGDDLLVYFGTTEIAARTAKKFGLPDWCVDNSPSLWGSSFADLRDIRNPEALRAIGKKAKVVICSAAETEIKVQLSQLGVLEENIALSPYARSIAPAQELTNIKMEVLIASGGPSSVSASDGGGLYLLSVDGASVFQKKLHGISSHGLIGNGLGGVVATTDGGLMQFNVVDNKISPFSILPSGTRPHGITLNEASGNYIVVGNTNDSLVSVSKNGEVIQVDPILRGSGEPGSALHHINDVAYSNGAIYLSMFSLTGSWKSGVYDGGIFALDAKTLRPLGPVISGATLPHSVRFREEEELWFCNSLPGLLTKGDREFELAFPTFARGLDFQGHIVVVGASRNRNIRDNKLETRTQIREVNSGIYITLLESGLSRFVPLEGLVPEIHDLKILSAS